MPLSIAILGNGAKVSNRKSNIKVGSWGGAIKIKRNSRKLVMAVGPFSRVSGIIRSFFGKVICIVGDDFTCCMSNAMFQLLGR
jgi:hypothetical protein